MKNFDPWGIERRLSKYDHDLTALITSFRYPIYFLHDMPGNWGDKLIHRGTEIFFETVGLETRKISMKDLLFIEPLFRTQLM